MLHPYRWTDIDVTTERYGETLRNQARRLVPARCDRIVLSRSWRQDGYVWLKQMLCAIVVLILSCVPLLAVQKRLN